MFWNLDWQKVARINRRGCGDGCSHGVSLTLTIPPSPEKLQIQSFQKKDCRGFAFWGIETGQKCSIGCTKWTLTGLCSWWRCFTTVGYVFLPFWPRHHLSTGCPGISHLIPSDGPGGMGGWAHRPRQDHLAVVEVQPRERRLSVANYLSVSGIPDDWGRAPRAQDFAARRGHPDHQRAENKNMQNNGMRNHCFNLETCSSEVSKSSNFFDQ